MSINSIRVFNIIFIFIMLTAGKGNFLWYIIAMHASIEFLNRRQSYLKHSYKFYNFIFFAYELVLLERLRNSHFSAHTEWLINSAEHLLFGLIICLKLYVYTSVFNNKAMLTRWQRGIIAFAFFNIIGLFNEVFQNSMANRILFVMIPDSVKDIQMNFLGGTVFMMAVFYNQGWLQYPGCKQ